MKAERMELELTIVSKSDIRGARLVTEISSILASLGRDEDEVWASFVSGVKLFFSRTSFTQADDSVALDIDDGPVFVIEFSLCAIAWTISHKSSTSSFEPST